MELQFLGGAGEIGSLGLVVRDQGRTLLFDYGMTPSDPPEYPRPAPVNLQAAFLTHAHLDHSGMTPILSRLNQAHVVATPVTAAVTDLLVRDALKIAKAEKYFEPFTPMDIRALQQRFEVLPAKSTFRRKGIEVDLGPAGHIPGASMYRYRGARDLLFTGDISGSISRLVGAAEPIETDILVMESTYAGREHPDRKVTEQTLRRRIDAVIQRGGTAIVPAFAVGRAQEVLLALADAGHVVYLDGMARKVNEIYLAAPEYVRDGGRLRRAIDNANIVESPADRKVALREAEVIVTTGGMLDGGPVLYYLSEMYRDPRHGIFLTGFQVEGSNGRQLVEHGTLTIDDVTVRPECEVAAFDFSSHAGHTELVDLVAKTKARTVVLMHGDHREELAKALRPDHEVLMPETGERFTL